MLKEIDTSGPLWTKCGYVTGTCSPQPLRRQARGNVAGVVFDVRRRQGAGQLHEPRQLEQRMCAQTMADEERLAVELGPEDAGVDIEQARAGQCLGRVDGGGLFHTDKTH